LRVTNVRPRAIAVAAINVSITGRLRRADSSPQVRAAAAFTGRTRSARAIAESIPRLASTPLRNTVFGNPPERRTALAAAGLFGREESGCIKYLREADIDGQHRP
jgi:hypothetical protein